jgi:hypothetical protein
MAVPAMDTALSGSESLSSHAVTWAPLLESTGDNVEPLPLRRTLPRLKVHMNATSFLNTPLLLPITEQNVTAAVFPATIASQRIGRDHSERLRYKPRIRKRKVT